MDLEKYGFEHCRTAGADMQEYKQKCGCFNATLSESINLIKFLNDSSASLRTERIGQVLQLAKDSCTMIKENNEEFYKLVNRWDDMNSTNEGNKYSLEFAFRIETY